MQITRGVWQMSLAMIISGSIGAFVLLSGLPVIDVVFWRCLIGALTLLVFIVLSRQPFSRLTRFTLALAVIGGAALTGGRGNVRGTLLGAFVIGFLSDGLVIIGVSAYWQTVFTGAVIVLAVLLNTLQYGRSRR